MGEGISETQITTKHVRDIAPEIMKRLEENMILSGWWTKEAIEEAKKKFREKQKEE